MAEPPRRFPISDRDSPRISGPEKPRGRPFGPGNPGRPQGSRNKLSRMREALYGDRAFAVRELAHAGDVHALEVILEYEMIEQVVACESGERNCTLRCAVRIL